jgi:hypothetical protein
VTYAIEWWMGTNSSQSTIKVVNGNRATIPLGDVGSVDDKCKQQVQFHIRAVNTAGHGPVSSVQTRYLLNDGMD